MLAKPRAIINKDTIIKNFTGLYLQIYKRNNNISTITIVSKDEGSEYGKKYNPIPKPNKTGNHRINLSLSAKKFSLNLFRKVLNVFSGKNYLCFFFFIKSNTISHTLELGVCSPKPKASFTLINPSF